MNNGKGKGRIITGPGGPESLDDSNGGEAPPIPALHGYWIIWFNPEIEKIEHVTLQAHTVDVYDDGMLIFKAFAPNTNAELIAMGALPVMGYYVSSFRNHIRFGQDVPQDIPTDSKVH